MTVEQSGARSRAPGPPLWLALVLVVLGVGLLVPTFVAGIVPVVRAVATPLRFEVPGAVRLHLGKGTYLLYEDTGATSFGSTFSHDNHVTITPDDVSVTDADTNVTVPVLDRESIVESLNSGGDYFVGAVRFVTPAAGTYIVRVSNTAIKPVLVARPLTDTIRSALVWFFLAGAGGIIAVVGVVLLIVGSVRRGRARRVSALATGVPVPVPAGWYPDPSGAPHWRYWDGYLWTEHVH